MPDKIINLAKSIFNEIGNFVILGIVVFVSWLVALLINFILSQQTSLVIPGCFVPMFVILMTIAVYGSSGSGPPGGWE